MFVRMGTEILDRVEKIAQRIFSEHERGMHPFNQFKWIIPTLKLKGACLF